MGILSFFDRVRYTIYGEPFGRLVIKEKHGWNDDEKELLRSPKYFGVMTNLSNSLDHYGNAFAALESAYEQDGIKANVRIEREERDDLTDDWSVTYSATFDFSTYRQIKNFIKIKFNESKFFKNIEGRLREKYE